MDVDEATLRRWMREEFERVLDRRKQLTPAQLEQRRQAGQRRAMKHTTPPEALEAAKPAESPPPAAPDPPAAPLPEKPKKSRSARSSASGEKPPKEESPTSGVWLGYMVAYQRRYGVFPVRNAKTAGMLAHLIRRIPRAEAPHVAEFYVGSDNPLYVRSGHCVELMLRDIEKLRMEWATGRKSNGTHALDANKAWWETWSGIQAKGAELKVEHDEQPQIYKAKVYKAAAASGHLPEHVAHKLGVR